MFATQRDITSRAMLIHCCQSTGAIDLTVHGILQDGEGNPTIGAGRVLGFEEKHEIVKILGDENNDAGFTLQNPQVLAKTPYALAWWMPKAEQEIIFRDNDGGVVRHKVMFPTIVGVYMRGTLHFAVTKGGKNARPDEDTPLFRIPLPNLYDGGSFCRGNADLPTGAKPANIPAWQSFVLSTVNTHLGMSPLDDVNSMEETVKAYEAAAKQGGRFPTNKLIPMDTTLGDWMAKLDARGKA